MSAQWPFARFSAGWRYPARVGLNARARTRTQVDGPPWSPLAAALPERVSPQLEHLLVKFAAHLPFAHAVEVLQDLLPLDECISLSAAKNRVRAVAEHLENIVATGIENAAASQRACDAVRHGQFDRG